MPIICKHKDCSTGASFGLLADRKRLYCSKHKLADMIDVVAKRCLADGCSKIPSYALSGSKKPLYCVTHKTVDMVNVVNRKCLADGCSKIPSYALIGTKKRLYCVTHKLADMVNIKSKRCLTDGCLKVPSYALSGTKKGLYCHAHKLADMVNVVNMKCLADGCSKIPNYALSGSKKGLYCFNHKLAGMDNVVSPKCKSCNNFYVCSKTNYLCSYCNPQSRLRAERKEIVVKRYLESHTTLRFIHDSVIATQGCFRQRPDFLFDLDTHIIVVEVDEHQHRGYDPECELSRMNNIVESFAFGLPVIIIRYNPDTYRVNGVIKKVPRTERLRALLARINQYSSLDWVSENMIKQDIRMRIDYLYYSDR